MIKIAFPLLTEVYFVYRTAYGGGGALHVSCPCYLAWWSTRAKGISKAICSGSDPDRNHIFYFQNFSRMDFPRLIASSTVWKLSQSIATRAVPVRQRAALEWPLTQVIPSDLWGLLGMCPRTLCAGDYWDGLKLNLQFGDQQILNTISWFDYDQFSRNVKLWPAVQPKVNC